mmetsp:Transcript_8696/g.14752  ORF Transcript_8696/g.14752 Transcript_8696/m.14752 type:complete len:631 (+) Transcript_8696:138-2030(+)
MSTGSSPSTWNSTGVSQPPSSARSVIDALHTFKQELSARQCSDSIIIRQQRDLELCASYEQILGCSFTQKATGSSTQRETAPSTQPLEDKLLALRRLVATAGLPSCDYYCQLPSSTTGIVPSDGGVPSLRSCVWKALLGALVADAAGYMSLLELGPGDADHKIRDDTFRTYKNNATFWGVVSESQLTRVLTATARVLVPQSNSGSGNDTLKYSNVGYVQGMNVLLAPFLYVMPSELDAFACFTALLAKHCPRYVLANLEGVHAGCSLAEACLAALDPGLHVHLSQRVQLQMEIFMFQYVLTLFANMTQLDQVLRVWDALFAFGIHFNCVLVATHIMLLRDELLQETSAFRVQRLILQSPLNAEVLVGTATRLLAFIPAPLREAMLLHPVEASAKSIARPGFRAGLLQKSRSKSSGSLQALGSSPDTPVAGDKRSTATRITYMSTSKLGSAVRRRPSSAPKWQRAEVRTGTGAAIVKPRPPSSTVSHSRILNPSLRSEGPVTQPAASSRRPTSAPRASQRFDKQSGRLQDGVQHDRVSRRLGVPVHAGRSGAGQEQPPRTAMRKANSMHNLVQNGRKVDLARSHDAAGKSRGAAGPMTKSPRAGATNTSGHTARPARGGSSGQKAVPLIWK